MESQNVFADSLPELKRLFPRLESQEISRIKNRYVNSENYWNTNGLSLNPKVIKYLLICEAPPANGHYFYFSTNDYLFKQVWKCFFGNQPICSNQTHAYQCLVNIGFLLIDTIPYPVKYKSRHRRKLSYLNLIKSYLPVWVNKLNSNLVFSPDLKISFGFKLNAYAVINASNGSITLGGIPRPLISNMIAATGAGQPSSTLLAQKFGIQKGSFLCKPCP